MFHLCRWSNSRVFFFHFLFQLLITITYLNHVFLFIFLRFLCCLTDPMRRRRMRCSTNIYLTALALADIVNLFFSFILSLQRYPSFEYGHSLYWSIIGLSHWLHDASRMFSSSYQIAFCHFFLKNGCNKIGINFTVGHSFIPCNHQYIRRSI